MEWRVDEGVLRSGQIVGWISDECQRVSGNYLDYTAKGL